jgi:hypothetical protein
VSTTSIHGTRSRPTQRRLPNAVLFGEIAPEQQLALLLAGTEESRRAHADKAIALLNDVDPARLLELLKRLHMTVLLGQRLLALGGDVDPQLERAIGSWAAAARDQGTMHELTTLTVLAGLERAGLRALALKGSVLARELYGDVAARTSGDIDALVGVGELDHAVAVVEGMGWRWKPQTARAAKLPLLHETLTHPTLPRVELHWRVHWYETRFAANALADAERRGPHQPLIMQPADGLAALTLFYARDGFAGLRMAADVAAWWDRRCDGGDADLILETIATSYPALAGPLHVGAQLLGSLVSLPTRFSGGPFRWKVAAELATPFFGKSPAQLGAIGESGAGGCEVTTGCCPPTKRRRGWRAEVAV